ncbi:unnamed protein product [Prunus armeniaca]|uniref:Uncharacterized protein n=1 Tax=Prunus armeniaca TaxID=36596 RepID=A0A6J5WDJ8_PRUAR|nr:unnamed protein product [Prunus armeniaca]
MPWVCFRNFNELLHSEEKEGGVVRPIRQILAFQEVVADCGLNDLGFDGPPFTKFMQHLDLCRSDHVPINSWSTDELCSPQNSLQSYTSSSATMALRHFPGNKMRYSESQKPTYNTME